MADATGTAPLLAATLQATRWARNGCGVEAESATRAAQRGRHAIAATMLNARPPALADLRFGGAFALEGLAYVGMCFNFGAWAIPARALGNRSVGQCLQIALAAGHCGLQRLPDATRGQDPSEEGHPRATRAGHTNDERRPTSGPKPESHRRQDRNTCPQRPPTPKATAPRNAHLAPQRFAIGPEPRMAVRKLRMCRTEHRNQARIPLGSSRAPNTLQIS